MKNHPFLCWLTLIFFLFSHFPNDLISAAQLASSDPLESSSKNFNLQGRLAIPNELGVIQKSWNDGSNASQPWVIHIQDLHVDYEAQKNVAAILKAIHFFLKSQDPAEIEKELLVAVEGASGKIDPTFFSSFPNAEVRQNTADYFLRKAGFTGPEFFSVLYPDWKLEIFGIEDKAVYLEHKEAYAQCIKSQLNGASWLNTVFKVREELKEKVLSKDAVTFLEKRSGFEDGKMNLAAYARFLTNTTRQKKISSKEAPNLKLLFKFLKSERRMEPDQVERERNQCLKDLSRRLPKEDLNDLVKKSLEYRLGRIKEGDYFQYLSQLIPEEELKNYPHLSRYVQLVRIRSKLNLNLVLEELKRLEEDLIEVFFKTSSEKEFLEFFESVQLIEKLFQLRMSREDLFKLKSKRDHLKEIFERYELTLLNDFQNFESFYRIAQVRDQVLFEKTHARMKESGRKIAILFTGGFHTEGLTQFFEKNNISYTVVTPKAEGFSQVTEELYRSRMLGNQNAFEEMLLAQIKSLHPGTFLAPLLRDPVIARQLQEIHRVQFEMTAGADAIAVQTPQIATLLNERQESLKTLFPEVSDLKFFDQEIQVDGVRYVLAMKGHEILAFRFVSKDVSLRLEEDRFGILESGIIGPYQLQVISASDLPRIFKIKHPKNRLESTLGKDALKFLGHYDVSYISARRFLKKIPAYKEVQLYKTSIRFAGATYFVGKHKKKVYVFRFVKGSLEEAPLPGRYSIEDSIQIGKLNLQILLPRVFKNLLRRTFLEKDIRERFPKDFFDFAGIRPTRPAWTDLAGESSEDLTAAVEVLRHYDVGRVIELAEIHGEVTEHGAAIYVEAEKGTYVLRPISSDIRSDSVNEARFEISLIQHLVQNGFPANDIISSNEIGPSEHPLDKHFVVHSNGKVYLLYDFVEGSVLQGEDLMPEERSAMVNTLARLHQLTGKGDFVGIRRLRRINDFRKWKAQLSNLRRILKEKKEKDRAYQYTNAEKFFLNRLPFILSQIAKFQKTLPVRRYEALPRTVIHGRFRPQNMVFKKNHNGTLPEVIGVFDWVDAREEVRVWDFLNGLFKRSVKSGRQFDLRMLRWVIDEYQKYQPLAEAELDAIPEIMRAKTLERISSLLLEFTRLPHRLRHDLSGIPDEERALWLLDHEKSIFEMAKRYVWLLGDIDRKIEDGSFDALKAMTLQGATKNAYINAIRQILRVAPYVGLTEDQLWELARPKRVVALEFPVLMDDGSVEVIKGYRVLHNDALGPTKGGLRYHPEATREEVKGLATEMTIKNSIAGLPYGGGKGGVEIEPKKYSKAEVARISRAYFRKLSELEAVGPNLDIPAPDVNTTGEIMSWMVDEYIQYQLEQGHLGLSVEELEEFENISREEAEKDPIPTPYLNKYIEVVNRKPEGERNAVDLGVLTGKPVEKGGSIGRTEATGQGVFYTTRMAVQKILKKESLKDVQIRIQGFGNVGSYTAKFLHEAGARITAVGDDTGSIENKEGIDIEKLLEYAKKNNGKIKGYPFANPISAEELLEAPCDVLIPAALGNQITERNADKIQARIVVEAANGPTTPEADQILEKRGIPVVPDVLANSGGVTVSYFEWLQNLNGERWTLDRVNRQLQTTMEMNFEAIYRVSIEKKVPFRLAAYIRGVGRVIEKMMVNKLRAPPVSGRKPTAFKVPGAERAPPAALPDAKKIQVILEHLLDYLDSSVHVLETIRVVPAVELPRGHEQDLAYSAIDQEGKMEEVNVRADLWERIKNDTKAQAILVRHEFVENVLIPQLVKQGILEESDLANAHNLTSYVDARMEGTPVHALMNYVIPLLSDDQLRAIELYHPNDPRKEFYSAVQTELETRRLLEKVHAVSAEQAFEKGERQATLFIHQPLIEQIGVSEALESARKQIGEIISKNHPIRANNRSLIVKLFRPIQRYPGDEKPITHLQVKGVLFDAKRPLRPHQGMGVAKTAVFDEEGYLELKEYSGIPQGGSWLKESLQEFLGTLNFQDGSIGFLTKYPFGWGEFSGLGLNGRRLGFVVLGMNDETRLERGIEEITASSLKMYGQMLRQLHGAGFIHQFPHPDNISIERTGLPVFHDLETILRRQDLNPLQDLGYLYWELRYVLAKLRHLLSQSALTEDGMNQLLVDFLRGYFGESGLEFSNFEISQFTDLFEYFNQRYSVEEIKDFNSIFKRLKEVAAEKFSSDVRELRIARGDVRIDGAFRTPGTGSLQAQAPPDAGKIKAIQEALRASEFENLPFEVVDSLGPEHEDDFAHFAKGKILVRQALWERIQNDPEAQRVLRRHEYVENVLIPQLVREGVLQEGDSERAHALTSAIDAIEEGTPVHALMAHVISLMSDAQLNEIGPIHPNDPERLFYKTVQKEIKRRLQVWVSSLLDKVESSEAHRKVLLTKDNRSLLPEFNGVRFFEGEIINQDIRVILAGRADQILVFRLLPEKHAKTDELEMDNVLEARTFEGMFVQVVRLQDLGMMDLPVQAAVFLERYAKEALLDPTYPERKIQEYFKYQEFKKIGEGFESIVFSGDEDFVLKFSNKSTALQRVFRVLGRVGYWSRMFISNHRVDHLRYFAKAGMDFFRLRWSREKAAGKAEDLEEKIETYKMETDLLKGLVIPSRPVSAKGLKIKTELVDKNSIDRDGQAILQKKVAEDAVLLKALDKALSQDDLDGAKEILRAVVRFQALLWRRGTVDADFGKFFDNLVLDAGSIKLLDIGGINTGKDFAQYYVKTRGDFALQAYEKLEAGEEPSEIIETLASQMLDPEKREAFDLGRVLIRMNFQLRLKPELRHELIQDFFKEIADQFTLKNLEDQWEKDLGRETEVGERIAPFLGPSMPLDDRMAFKIPGTGPVGAQAPPDAAKIKAIQARLNPAEFATMPLVPVDTLGSGHDQDFAHLAEGKILVRKDLWERIKDDSKAQFILRRHEYVENVLIPRLINENALEESDRSIAHALTSAIDALEEGTPVHALMRHVIPLVSDAQLTGIRQNHPNDPRGEFFLAVEHELESRLAQKVLDQSVPIEISQGERKASFHLNWDLMEDEQVRDSALAAIKEIAAVVTANHEVQDNERSMTIKLRQPILRFPGDDNPVTHVQLKGIVFDARQPLVEHFGAGRARAIEFDNEGRIHVGDDGGKPQGGAWLKEVMAEFLNTYNLQQAAWGLNGITPLSGIVQTKFPIAWGAFPDAKLNGRSTGFVVLGLNSKTSEKRAFGHFDSVTFRTYGMLVRKLHEAGFIHTALHPGNVSIFHEQLPVIHDLGDVLEIEGMSSAQLMGYVYHEVTYIVSQLHHLFGERGDRLSQDFLKGYFGDGHFQMSAKQIEKFREIINRLSRVRIQEVQTKNPIFRRLEEDVERIFLNRRLSSSRVTKKVPGEEDLSETEVDRVRQMIRDHAVEQIRPETLEGWGVEKALRERKVSEVHIKEHQAIVDALLSKERGPLLKPISIGNKALKSARVEIYSVDFGAEKGFRLAGRTRPFYEWSESLEMDGQALVRIYIPKAFIEAHQNHPSILAQALTHPLVEHIAGRTHLEAVQHEAFYQEKEEERNEALSGEGVLSDYSKWALEEAAREGDWDYLRRMTEPYQVNREKFPNLSRQVNGRAFTLSTLVTGKAWDLLFENKNFISSILKLTRDKSALLLFVRALWWRDEQGIQSWIGDLLENEIIDDTMIESLLTNSRITPSEHEMILNLYQRRLMDDLKKEGIRIQISDGALKKENHIRLLSRLKRFPDWLEQVNPEIAFNRESTGNFKVRSWITSLRLDSVEFQRRFSERIKYFLLFHFTHLAGYNAINYLASLRGVDRNFMTALDHSIPLVPETGWIYYLFYPLIVLPAFLVKKVKDFRSALGAYFSALGVLFTVFLVYPARMPRPEINPDESLSSYFLDLFYQLDLPYNTTPSTHATLAFLTGLILVRTTEHFGRSIHLLIGASIGLSTLFVRQHFVVDVVTGWGLAYVIYKFWFDGLDWVRKFLKNKLPRLANKFSWFKVPAVEKYPPISIQRTDAEAFKDLTPLELILDASQKGEVSLHQGKIYIHRNAWENGEESLFSSLYNAVLTKISRASRDSLPEIIIEDAQLDQRLGRLGKKDLVPLNSSILGILGGEARLKPWFEALGLEYSFADLQGFLNSWRIYFVVSPGMMGDRSAYRLGTNLVNSQGEVLLEKGDLLLNYGQFDFLLTQAALAGEETERHKYYRSAFALLLEAVHHYLYPQNLPDQIKKWKSKGIEGAFRDERLRLVSQYVDDADFDRAVWEILSGNLKLFKGERVVKFYTLLDLMKSPKEYQRIARQWLDEGIHNVSWDRPSGTQILLGLNTFLQGPPRRFSGGFELKVFQDPLGVNQAILKPVNDTLRIEKFYPRDLALPKSSLFLDDADEYFESSA